MAQVTSSTGIVGGVIAAGTYVVSAIGAAASFNYQIITGIWKGIGECGRMASAIFTTMMTAFGEIVHYLLDFFAECGNVLFAFVKLGTKLIMLLYYVFCLILCGVSYLGETIASALSVCLKIVLLAVEKVSVSAASVWHYIKEHLAEITPDILDSIASVVNRFARFVNNTVHNGAKYIAASVGAILGTAYDTVSMTAMAYWEVISSWLSYFLETVVCFMSACVCHIQQGFQFLAQTFQKHINVDCYMLVFLATTVAISVKIMLDYMNKRDLTIPLFGFRRPTRMRVANRLAFMHAGHANIIDSSDEEIFNDDGFDNELESSEDLTASESDAFDDSDSITHEEYELGSDSDDSVESDVESVQIQLPPFGGYNLRTRKTSPSPSHSGGTSPQMSEEEELNIKCVVCQDLPKSVVVLPCRHMCLCVDCAHTIASSRSRVRKVCPLCRGRIHTVMNIYL